MSSKPIRVLSLFSGCGGMDLGFEGGFPVLKRSLDSAARRNWVERELDARWVLLKRNPFQTVFANDIRPGAKKVWDNYFVPRGAAPDAFHLESVVNLVKEAETENPNVFPEADIVTGGFPCQDFSLAGKRKGFNSDKGHHGGRLTDEDAPSEENRGKLYMWMRRVISLTRPKMFIAENVKGLVSLGDVKAIIEKDFSAIGGNGYAVLPAKVLRAPEFGVPQTRERVIFFGFRKDILTPEASDAFRSDQPPASFDPYPTPTHRTNKFVTPNSINLPPFVTAQEAFVDLPEPDQADDLSQRAYSKAKWYGKHCQGNREIYLDAPGPTIRSEHHGNIEFRRLAPEHGGSNEPGLPERRLTPRECARLQTFPDNMEFVRKAPDLVSGSEAYKLIGNAVPPLLAYHIARRVAKLFPKIFKY